MNRVLLASVVLVFTAKASTLVSVETDISNPSNLFGPLINCQITNSFGASCSTSFNINGGASATASASPTSLSAFSGAGSNPPIHTDATATASFSNEMLITGGTGSGILNTTLTLMKSWKPIHRRALRHNPRERGRYAL